MPPEPYSPVRPDDHFLWSVPDDADDYQATESEVISLLGALVKALKPHQIVEVGTHRGYATFEMGLALQENGRGKLDSFEILPQRVLEARERCKGLPVTIHNAKDTKVHFTDQTTVDFLFIDGELDNRKASFMHWLPVLADGATVAVHDSLKYKEVNDFIREIGWPQITLHTPRGLTIFKRP